MAMAADSIFFPSVHPPATVGRQPYQPRLTEEQRRYKLSFAEDVQLVRFCTAERGRSLLATALRSKVEVHEVTIGHTDDSCFRLLASFYLGSLPTALAWSPLSISPRRSEGGREVWNVELIAGCEDKRMRLLTASDDQAPLVETVTDRSSGHSRRITDVAFCSAEGYERVFASVSEDHTLLIWNLAPNDVEGTFSEPKAEDMDEDDSSAPEVVVIDDGEGEKERETAVKPTIYAIPFHHPLLSVSFHHSMAKMLMVLDDVGTVYLLDWLSPGRSAMSLGTAAAANWAAQPRQHVVLTFNDPKSLAAQVSGGRRAGGCADWKSDSHIFGATINGRWVVWDLRKLNGGKPVASGLGHGESALPPSAKAAAAAAAVTTGATATTTATRSAQDDRFRWCPASPHYFATSTSSPSAPFPVQIHHTAHPETPTKSVSRADLLLSTASSPDVEGGTVRDISWYAGTEANLLAVAVGHRVALISLAFDR